MNSQKVPVTHINAISGRKGLLGMISFPDMLSGNTTFTRFFIFVDGNWWHKDFDFDCKSLSYVNNPSYNYKAWWLLGKNGETIELLGDGSSSLYSIPGAGLNQKEPYGYVDTIKNINNELYVCGYGRQVYKRVGDQWLSIADEILTHETATGFFDIDGTEGANLYAVGWKGEIFFYDGIKWHKDNSPTNAHLASVRCLGHNQIWICGNKGIVLNGQLGKWKVIKDDDFNGNWYCIEEYGGKIYLAGQGILAYIDGDSIIPIDIGIDKSITTHRLHAKDGLLWSIGEKDILVYDGTSWKEILHPDNE